MEQMSDFEHRRDCACYAVAGEDQCTHECPNCSCRGFMAKGAPKEKGADGSERVEPTLAKIADSTGYAKSLQHLAEKLAKSCGQQLPPTMGAGYAMGLAITQLDRAEARIEALEAEILAYRRGSGWISVQDSIPMRGSRVLVYRGKAHKGTEPEYAIVYWYDHEPMCKSSSHYMRLPLPPTEAVVE